VLGQNSRERIFTVRGQVIESDTRKSISNVEILVNNGKYTTTNFGGEFRIDVKIGDLITIKHEDFDTVYHTIDSEERITLEVLPSEESELKEDLREREISFNRLIDSAEVYKKVSAEKSIQFITESISKSKSVKENAQAFEVLGDVYMQWKQYDLAISNYKISLNNTETNEVNLKLGMAYNFNKDNQNSLATYNAIDKNGLSNYQLVTLYENLGDVYFQTGKYSESIKAYNSGLEVAEKKKIKTKVTDLNAKLGKAFNKKGNRSKAKKFYSNSLDLATQENIKREVEAKEQVADFQNVTRNYDDEIQTRKEVIDNIKEIEKDSIIANESPLTIQKQNYKIGNALFLQEDYEEAIPYLNKSIEEADKREDLVVKKDAFSQRLSEKQTRINLLEVDKKLTNSQMETSVERAKRQQLIIYSLIGGMLLV